MTMSTVLLQFHRVYEGYWRCDIGRDIWRCRGVWAPFLVTKNGAEVFSAPSMEAATAYLQKEA